MINPYLKPFEKDFPIYICPWCDRRGYYNHKIRIYERDCFYLEAHCLYQCNKDSTCKCMIYYPKTLCKKHSSEEFELKISIKKGRYDIMRPNELLWKKQKFNCMRIFRFMRNYTYMDINLVKNADNHKNREDIPIDNVLTKFHGKIFSKLKVNIYTMKYVCEMYELPIELVDVILQLMIFEFCY
jgi:hypothetical protein